MMLRVAASLLLLLALTVVETSFVASLPAPFSATPFVIACSVYVIQHLGVRAGVWWLIGYGLLLDVWQVGALPLETVGLGLTAFAVLFLSREWFSNRSLYGVGAALLAALTVFHVWHVGVLLVMHASNPTRAPWTPFFVHALAQAFFGCLVIALLFRLTLRVRGFLRQILILPASEPL